MKLTKNKDLQIFSLKHLYDKLENNLSGRKTIAIICSANEIDESKLYLLDAHIILRFHDTYVSGKQGAFSRELAAKAAEFLGKHSDFQQIYVCCDSGESRSTAMAAAIMKYYGRSDVEIWKNPYYHPNPLVYKNQCLAFGKKVSAIKLRYLRYINEKALDNFMDSKK